MDKSVKDNLAEANSEVVMKIYATPTLNKNYYREIISGIKIPARTDHTDELDDGTPVARYIHTIDSPVYIQAEEKMETSEEELKEYIAKYENADLMKKILESHFQTGLARYQRAYEKQMLSSTDSNKKR